MSIKYKEFANPDCQDALKKLGEFPSNKNLKELEDFIRKRNIIKKEIEIYDQILSSIVEKHNQKANFISSSKITDIEKTSENTVLLAEYSQNKFNLDNIESKLEPLFDYEFIKKSEISGNNIFYLFPLIKDFPSE